MGTAIQTEGLTVRPFRRSDLCDLLEYLSLPEAYRCEPGDPIDATEARRLARLRARGSSFHAIEHNVASWRVIDQIVNPLPAGSAPTA